MTALSRPAFDELRQHVRRLCGVALGDDKEYLVRHRLGPVAFAAGLTSLDELAVRLRDAAAAALADAVVEAITTKETSFFRDGHPFEMFRTHLLPGLLAKAQSGGRPRVWSAAASTGQEAYSLAMLVHEAAGPPPPGGDVVVVGTDISAAAVAAAAAGAFTAREVARGVSPGRLARFFQPRPGGFAATAELRRRVEFRRARLDGSLAVPGPFEVVFCRNVLIYFDEPTRKRVLDRLHAALVPGGWLVLGAAESLYGLGAAFAAESLGGSTAYRRA